MTPGPSFEATQAAAPSADPRAQASEAFASLLDDVRRKVDAALGVWLEPRVAAAKSVSAEVGAAAEAVHGLTLRGGKRMRAALVHAGYVACGGGHDEIAATMPAMLAVELLQTYLLIHDDWMDDDDVRRGGPSVHVTLRARLADVRLGDAAAILAGDLASGYAQCALLESPLPPARVLGAARAFARIQEDVVTGQLAEMTASGATSKVAAPSVETIHELKTASYTVTGPLALGAHLAGASDSRIAELARYGRPLGIAFQLRDDLLGTFGDASATGKPVGNDIRQGKRTALVAEMRGDAKAEALLARVLGRQDASDDDTAAVVRAMETTGAKARVEARVAELLGEARAALAAMELAPSSPASAWLAGAVRALGERSS